MGNMTNQHLAAAYCDLSFNREITLKLVYSVYKLNCNLNFTVCAALHPTNGMIGEWI